MYLYEKNNTNHTSLTKLQSNGQSLPCMIGNKQWELIILLSKTLSLTLIKGKFLCQNVQIHQSIK